MVNCRMIKLNLGCGDRKIHGFINIDQRAEVYPDVIADITNLNYKDIDLIYAAHVLEHFKNSETCKILRNWYECLKIGGTLRISVPDFEAIVEYYNRTKDLTSLLTIIYGGHKYDLDYHFTAFDFETLFEKLTNIGFKDIKRYDWRKTEHFYVDDHSQAYLPHMDKITGILMSLNVEAKK